MKLLPFNKTFQMYFDQKFLSTNFGLFTVSLVWYGFIGFNFDFQYLIVYVMFVSVFIQS